MKYLLGLVISITLSLWLKNGAQASTVSVSSDTTTSVTNETVVNGLNTVNINSNGGNSKTHVCVETNGEKKCFDAEGDESVDWKSDDGKSQVKINTNTVTNNSANTSSPAPTKLTPSPTDKEDKDSVAASESSGTAKKEATKTQKETESLIDVIIGFVKSLFS